MLSPVCLVDIEDANAVRSSQRTEPVQRNLTTGIVIISDVQQQYKRYATSMTCYGNALNSDMRHK